MLLQAGSNRRVTFKDSSHTNNPAGLVITSGMTEAGVLSGNISTSSLQPGMVHILSKGMMVPVADVSFLGAAATDANGVVTEEAKQDLLDEQAG